MSTSTCSFELPDGFYYDCDCENCKPKSLIQRFLRSIELLKHLTKPETMAARDDPLADAFKLSKEIRKLKKMFLKKELQGLSKRCKRFAVGLCNECGDETEIAALYNFDVEQLRELTPEKSAKAVEILNEAVLARHREVLKVSVLHLPGHRGEWSPPPPPPTHTRTHTHTLFYKTNFVII